MKKAFTHSFDDEEEQKLSNNVRNKWRNIFIPSIFHVFEQ